MALLYASKLGFKTWKTDMGAQKIDSLLLKTFKIVMPSFQIIDTLFMAQFFQETFLLANTSMKMVLRMFFFTLNNTNIQFTEKKLTWRLYTIKKVLLTSQRIKLIDKKKFAKAVLDENVKAFVVYVALLLYKMIIHLAWKVQIALLIAEKVTVPIKSADFSNIFLKELVKVLLEWTGINKHVGKLVNTNNYSIDPYIA